MKAFLFLLFTISTFLLNAQTIELETVANGINNPVEIKHAGDDRLFIVEQTGRIKIIQADGTVNNTPFLNVSNLISSGGERGLLGLAFAPDYAETGRFYINYTNNSGDTTIARYTVSANPDVANSSGQVLLTIDQPFSNHNGGNIHFGQDGYLYISMGDGGYAGDPNNYGQNKNSLLGKMLRIDVSGENYTSPADNPFVGVAGADEIWAYGLRNAWKFSFDHATDEIWIADVGQNAIEEINVQSVESEGLNYGWRCYEGNDTYNPSGCANASTMIFPVATYSHSNGRCSITGGYVYRGTEFENMMGKYFFADYCSGEIGMVDENTLTWMVDIPNVFFTTFGVDYENNLYIAGSGRIYKVIDSDAMSTTNVSLPKPQIYPNPAKDIVQIKNMESLDKIMIFSSEGKLLKEIQQPNENQFSVAEFPKGIYLIQLISGNKIHSYKIIKE